MSLKKKLNYLQKVKEVQDEFSIYDDGIRLICRIHNYHIEPKYKISLRTLSRYLEVNVKKELAKIENEKNIIPQ